IATLPMLAYAASVWGVGLGGGYALAFGSDARLPAVLHGAAGFWCAATMGGLLAASTLVALLGRATRRR
ncbi:MAG: MATE family efflux transporter, partial [Burkholderiales bacterium]|nr:MATE family efflux transporter [Burkholderiales bacterium]